MAQAEAMSNGNQMRIALICHWPADKPYWLEDLLRDQGFSVTRFSYRWGRRRSRLRAIGSYAEAMFLGGRAKRFAAIHGAVIVASSEGHRAGVFASIAPVMHGHWRPPALCMNLMLYDKPGPRTGLRKLLYRTALLNRRITFTVSTGDLRDHYARLLATRSERFVVLPDCYAPGHRALPQHDPVDDGGYAFVGGDAARDWETAIAAARACPTVSFLFVARSRSWRNVDLPPNVELRFDLPLGDFFEAMRRSRLVLVPLSNDVVTAGIIVVTHGAIMDSLVIATRTPATELYYPPECSDLLMPMGDTRSFANCIRKYWEDEHERRAAADRLQAFVLEHHSPEAYAQAVGSWVRSAFRETAP